MSEQSFTTPEPLHLHVEVGSGHVRVTADDTGTTVVRLEGPGAAETTVTLDNGRLDVLAPLDVGFFRSRRVDVTVTLPSWSSLDVATGSGTIETTGRIRDAEARSGSGYVSIDDADSATVRTGSGDVSLGIIAGAISVKTGSGDVDLRVAGGDCVISSGSGDVRANETRGAIAVKTGSGGLRVASAGSDVSLATGSGTLQIERIECGRVTLKGASGNARIGVAAGIPVWTDIRTLTGQVRSDLESLGAPAEGQDHVEVRANTVSGSIHLAHV